ncbi:MAG: hypothetical protein IPF99_17185 [Deltaproteobacteria bacterium]|nr:hypothetical protein [Deltaproteobacteria bacterium]
MANSKTAGKKAPSIPAREAVIAAAGALPAKDIQRPPPYAAAWLAWADNLARLAAKDAGALLLVPLSEGALTVGELERFAAGVALAQEYVMIAGVLRISAAGTETDAERSLLWSVRADQRRLDRALLLRFADDSAGRAFLTGLRRGDPTDPVDALDDTEKLLALADSDAHREWLASLPKGEAAAVKRLHDALPALRAAVKRLAPSKEAAEKRELFRRVLTLLVTSAARIGRAGRYLTGDVPGRERAYAAFKRPKAKRARKKKPTE